MENIVYHERKRVLNFNDAKKKLETPSAVRLHRPKRNKRGPAFFCFFVRPISFNTHKIDGTYVQTPRYASS